MEIAIALVSQANWTNWIYKTSQKKTAKEIETYSTN
jgi:hypothetical protein